MLISLNIAIKQYSDDQYNQTYVLCNDDYLLKLMDFHLHLILMYVLLETIYIFKPILYIPSNSLGIKQIIKSKLIWFISNYEILLFIVKRFKMIKYDKYLNRDGLTDFSNNKLSKYIIDIYNIKTNDSEMMKLSIHNITFYT